MNLTKQVRWARIDESFIIIIIIVAMFFKFETIDGHEVSLTGSHNIPIYDRKEKRLKVIRSSDVTIHDQLIIRGRKIALKNITTHSAQGFYSPLTMTSYLMVNDILTHVFSDK